VYHIIKTPGTFPAGGVYGMKFRFAKLVQDFLNIVPDTRRGRRMGNTLFRRTGKKYQKESGKRNIF